MILPHNVNRVVVEADCSFAEFRDRYESTVPTQDNEKVKALAASGKSLPEIVAEVNASTKYGFFIFWKMDAMPIMRVAGHNGECVEYLMGNYTIAERMFKHALGDVVRSATNPHLYWKGRQDAIRDRSTNDDLRQLRRRGDLESRQGTRR